MTAKKVDHTNPDSDVSYLEEGCTDPSLSGTCSLNRLPEIGVIVNNLTASVSTISKQYSQYSK